ncbi:MAG: hypothetical protein NT166_04000 [Candidatus Aminicenantes bacterium]|nr:hypothetical protein [Candidatus Aminicenantes bacterium]
MPENMLIKKVGGNWHKIQVWKEWVLSYKSGGVVMVNPDHPVIKDYYIPFYHFSDFTLDKDYLFIRDNKGDIFRMVLDNVQQTHALQPLERVQGFSFTGKDEKAQINVRRLEGLPEEPRAVDADNRITAVAYTQKGIDFFLKDSGEKIAHFDFPGYSFVDDIKLQGNRLYIADVFGLRILDISDLKHIVLDDRFAAFKGWPKDMALYKHYLLVADVLGIKIYDKQKDFAMVGKIESNRNRVAKVITKGDYAFLSCEAIGLKVADLSDIGNPRLVSGIVLPKGVWDCDVYEGYAYLAAYTGGLLKIDCSDNKNLKKVGSYTGDEEEVIGVHVNDRAVYAACSHDGFKIFDHQLNLKAEVKGIQGRCWTILENDGYLFIAAGKGGVFIYDVNEPDSPMLVNRVQTVEARDLFIQDQFLYIADGQNGALIYSIADVLNIEYINKIPSAAFTRGIMADEKHIYKADGDGGVEIYERFGNPEKCTSTSD